MIYRAEKGLVEEMVIKAPPLGGISAISIASWSTPLGHGDVLVLMSDGFPERFNQEGEMFDYPRARRSLAEAASSARARSSNTSSRGRLTGRTVGRRMTISRSLCWKVK